MKYVGSLLVQPQTYGISIGGGGAGGVVPPHPDALMSKRHSSMCSPGEGTSHSCPSREEEWMEFSTSQTVRGCGPFASHADELIRAAGLFLLST